MVYFDFVFLTVRWELRISLLLLYRSPVVPETFAKDSPSSVDLHVHLWLCCIDSCVFHQHHPVLGAAVENGSQGVRLPTCSLLRGVCSSGPFAVHVNFRLNPDILQGF